MRYNSRTCSGQIQSVLYIREGAWEELSPRLHQPVPLLSGRWEDIQTLPTTWGALCEVPLPILLRERTWGYPDPLSLFLSVAGPEQSNTQSSSLEKIIFGFKIPRRGLNQWLWRTNVALTILVLSKFNQRVKTSNIHTKGSAASSNIQFASIIKLGVDTSVNIQGCRWWL